MKKTFRLFPLNKFILNLLDILCKYGKIFPSKKLVIKQKYSIDVLQFISTKWLQFINISQLELGSLLWYTYKNSPYISSQSYFFLKGLSQIVILSFVNIELLVDKISPTHTQVFLLMYFVHISVKHIQIRYIKGIQFLRDLMYLTQI